MRFFFDPEQKKLKNLVFWGKFFPNFEMADPFLPEQQKNDLTRTHHYPVSFVTDKS